MRTWAPDDRPREKLVQKGPSALSDAELLAILIGTGTREESALDLARNILAGCGNSLVQLGRLTLSELVRHRGMGEAKSVSVLAALELSRRRRSGEVSERSYIRSARDVYEYFSEKIGDLLYEEFWALYLNRNNQLLAADKLGEGGINSTVVDPKKLFLRALQHHASCMIVAHNHPSGNLSPSNEDIRITRKIFSSGKNLDLPLIDHVIIAQTGYFSFADEGILAGE
jgi:DNA repair protein RadC